MSQLHILQGISGTGKTSLATAFAKAVGGVCTTIPVQAGWRDRADLLGHYNAFEKRYYERNTLQAIYRAQTEAYDDFIKFKGEQGAKDAGKMRAEGKEYVVKDGDVLNFLFNV